MKRIHINSGAGVLTGQIDPGTGPIEFHERLPGYRPGPLIESPSAASALGVAKVLVKDESSRFGLPSFKILGASWAVYRAMIESAGPPPGGWRALAELAEAAGAAGPEAIVTASDGNHGRAVARVASWLGVKATVFMPAGTSEYRIKAVESEGAVVRVVDGDYDSAVREAAAAESERVWLIQDTSWPGYRRIPSFVVDGYSTICLEAERALEKTGGPKPDLIAVQIGVGSLASAVTRHFKAPGRGWTPLVMGVEPEGADCAFESARKGTPVTVAGPHRSIMAGLNCGTVSTDAWPVLRDGMDIFASVPDEYAFEGMRILARDGIVSGESGAAGLAGLLALLSGGDCGIMRERLGIGGDSVLMIISTEGITDPGVYWMAVKGGPSLRSGKGSGG